MTLPLAMHLFNQSTPNSKTHPKLEQTAKKKILIRSQRQTRLAELHVLVPAQSGLRPRHGAEMASGALTDALQLSEERWLISSLALWEFSAVSSLVG